MISRGVGIIKSPSPIFTEIKMTQKSILSKIHSIEEQLARVSERLYQPQINSSDYNELIKRKKKMDKELSKLRNKLSASTEENS